MVSLNTSSSIKIVADIYQELLNKFRTIDSSSLEGAFAASIYHRSGEIFNPSLPESFTLTNYKHVAQLSYLIDSRFIDYQGYVGQLEEGLRRVVGRPITFMDSEPAPFR